MELDETNVGFEGFWVERWVDEVERSAQSHTIGVIIIQSVRSETNLECNAAKNHLLPYVLIKLVEVPKDAVTGG